MDTFRIQPLTENDIRTVVESCGGAVAHPDAHLRTQRGGDFIIEGAVIELKILDEDGLLKSERQVKLAKLFRDEGFTAPVVVLERIGSVVFGGPRASARSHDEFNAFSSLRNDGAQ